MKRARHLPAFGLLLAFALGNAWVAAWAATSRSAPIATYESVELVRVVDGDTLRLNVEIAPGVWERNRRCRLVDVNVPELSTAEGRKAAAAVREFLQGKRLRLRVYGVDQYGRWLVRLDVRSGTGDAAGGVDLSAWILEQKLGVARK